MSKSEVLNSSSKWLKWIVFIFPFLLYANTLQHQFALDDYSVIIEHQHVQAGIDGIAEILTTNYRNGQAGFNDGLYRPLSLVTFAIEKSWFNNNPSIAHFINVLLYSIGILLLFLSFKRVFSDLEIVIPFGIVLLFAAHPLHTEIVANIKGRDELLAFFGLTLSLYYFLHEKKQLSHVLIAILGLLIALFSKENAVTFALLIPAIIYLKKDKNIKDLQIILMITIPLAVGFLLLRNYIVDSMANPVDEGNFGLLNNPIAATDDFSLRWGSTFALQITFLLKLLFPFELIHDYSYNQLPLVKLLSASSIFGILIYALLGVASIYGIIKKNIWGIIAFIYLLAIVVASQILLPIGIQFAERMLFIAVLPLSIAIPFLLRNLLWKRKDAMSKKKQKSLLFIILAITSIYSFKTIDRNADWENNYTLYSADIEAGKNSARANYNIGSTLSDQADATQNALQKKQLLEQSRTYLQNAITIYPDYLDAWNNLGVVFKKEGNYKAAIQTYINNIQRDPNYSKNYYNLATAYYQMGDYRNSIQAFEEYTQRVPNSASAYMLMAQAAGSLNSFEEAINYLNYSLQYDPNNANAFNMLGMAYGSLNQFPNAENAFQKALQIESRRTDIMMNMAVNFNRQNKVNEEIRTLQQILAIQPSNRAARQQLIISLESIGRNEEAAKYRSQIQ